MGRVLVQLQQCDHQRDGDDPAAAARRAQGHDTDLKPIGPTGNGALSPAGGLRSTAHDLLQLLDLFLSGAGPEELPQAARLMLTLDRPEPADAGRDVHADARRVRPEEDRRPIAGGGASLLGRVELEDLARVLLGQWEMLAKLREIPDTAEEFTGFAIEWDLIAGLFPRADPYRAIGSATVRNVMADLQDAGLLYAPHTSAGRLPTAAGLRLRRARPDVYLEGDYLPLATEVTVTAGCLAFARIAPASRGRRTWWPKCFRLVPAVATASINAISTSSTG